MEQKKRSKFNKKRWIKYVSSFLMCLAHWKRWENVFHFRETLNVFVVGVVIVSPTERALCERLDIPANPERPAWCLEEFYQMGYRRGSFVWSNCHISGSRCWSFMRDSCFSVTTLQTFTACLEQIWPLKIQRASRLFCVSSVLRANGTVKLFSLCIFSKIFNATMIVDPHKSLEPTSHPSN